MQILIFLIVNSSLPAFIDNQCGRTGPFFFEQIFFANTLEEVVDMYNVFAT